MAIADFVPKIWSARFLSNLNKRLVWGSVFGFDHSGEVRDGDTLKIPTFSKVVSVSDYTGADIVAAQEANGSVIDVSLDKQKYIHIFVDDVDATQARPDLMDRAMERASYALSLQMDKDLRASIDVQTGHTTTYTTAHSDDAFTKGLLGEIAAVKGKMTNAGIPEEGRWAVISSHTQLALDTYFISAAAGVSLFVPATAEQSLRSGFIGRLLGFDLRLSGQPLTSGSGAAQLTHVILGQGTENQVGALQIDSMEAYRPEARFGDAIKSLMVYGSDVIDNARTWAITHKQSTSL